MLHSFPQSIFRKKTGSLAYCFHVTLSISISTFYTSVYRNHKYLKGTFVTKPVHFQSQYRQSKKTAFQRTPRAAIVFYSYMLSQNYFLLVLELIHAGSKNYSSAII